MFKVSEGKMADVESTYDRNQLIILSSDVTFYRSALSFQGKTFEEKGSPSNKSFNCHSFHSIHYSSVKLK